MTLAIRPATSADIPAITRIYAHAVEYGTASFELTSPDEAEMTKRMNDLVARKFPYLAAELDGALAGYAYAAPYRARPAYRFTVESSVYVAPDMHRRGVGKARCLHPLRIVTALSGCGHVRIGARAGGSARGRSGRCLGRRPLN